MVGLSSITNLISEKLMNIVVTLVTNAFKYLLGLSERNSRSTKILFADQEISSRPLSKKMDSKRDWKTRWIYQRINHISFKPSLIGCIPNKLGTCPSEI